MEHRSVSRIAWTRNGTWHSSRKSWKQFMVDLWSNAGSQLLKPFPSSFTLFYHSYFQKDYHNEHWSKMTIWFQIYSESSIKASCASFVFCLVCTNYKPLEVHQLDHRQSPISIFIFLCGLDFTTGLNISLCFHGIDSCLYAVILLLYPLPLASITARWIFIIVLRY